MGQAVFEKRLKIREDNMRLLFVIALIASMLFATDAAYALGGGGIAAMVAESLLSRPMQFLKL